MSEKFFKFLVLCLISFLMFVAIGKIFYLNLSESLPLGLYVRVPKLEIERGNYIVYEPSEEVKKIIIENGWGDGEQKFLKIVAGVGGDEFEIDETHQIFLVNGKFFGRVFQRDSNDKKIPQLKGKFKISEGEILPVGKNLRSFDGRYTGTIKESEIEAKVIPLVTWEGENLNAICDDKRRDSGRKS